jgi:glycosyltransferase involved in cell wall biosynthesis
MTSSREGWGMIVTEAAACGTPAVVTRVPGFVDAVVEGETGLLADTREGIAAALHTVLSDAAFRARLGERAREFAIRFTWEATARGTLEVLAQAAVRRRAKR